MAENLQTILATLSKITSVATDMIRQRYKANNP